MFEFIVILCLDGDPSQCLSVKADTDDCVRTLYDVRETAPENAVIRALACKRKSDLVLPPMKVTPESEAKPKKTLRT